MEVGKLYQVVELFPDAVPEPLDHVFYLTTINPKTKEAYLTRGNGGCVSLWPKLVLTVDDIFLFLGDLKNPSVHVSRSVFVTLLFNGVVWGSNCEAEEVYKYHGLKQVG